MHVKFFLRTGWHRLLHDWEGVKEALGVCRLFHAVCAAENLKNL